MNVILILFVLMMPQTPPTELGSIEGIVVSATTGIPLDRATVGIGPAIPPSRENGALHPYSVTTDKSGRFTISGILPAPYMLSGMREGYVRQTYGRVPIMIAKGQHRKDIVIRLTPTGVVTGRVLDADGQPLANIDVNLLKVAYEPDGQKTLRPHQIALTNDLGEYRLFWATPGQYYVEVEYRRLTPNSYGLNSNGGNLRRDKYMPTFYPGTRDLSAALPVNVPAGTEVNAIDVIVESSPTYTIRGHLILDPALAGLGMKPNIGLRKKQFSGAVMTSNETLTRGDGFFEFPNLFPGTYGLIASLNDSRSARGPVPAPHPESAVVIEVVDRNIDDVTLVLSPGITLNGRLSIEETPQASKAMTLNLRGIHPVLRPGQEMTQGVFLTNTNQRPEVLEDGTFSFLQINPGTYHLVMAGLPPDYFVKKATLGAVDVLRNGLTVERSRDVPLEITISSNGARIQGTVMDADGHVVPGGTVTLIPTDPGRSDLYRTYTTGTNGEFSMRGIPPGSYKLYAWNEFESGAQHDPDFMQPYAQFGTAIEIEEGALQHVNLNIIR
jgi:Carboxypeptidase regulatory-like domain